MIIIKATKQAQEPRPFQLQKKKVRDPNNLCELKYEAKPLVAAEGTRHKEEESRIWFNACQIRKHRLNYVNEESLRVETRSSE